MTSVLLPVLGLGIPLGLSIFLNFSLFFKLSAARRIKRGQSLELQEFLSDLSSGGGMLAVKRIDPNDIFMRTPKQTP